MGSVSVDPGPFVTLAPWVVKSIATGKVYGPPPAPKPKPAPVAVH